MTDRYARVEDALRQLAKAEAERREIETAQKVREQARQRQLLPPPPPPHGAPATAWPYEDDPPRRRNSR